MSGGDKSGIAVIVFLVGMAIFIVLNPWQDPEDMLELHEIASMRFAEMVEDSTATVPARLEHTLSGYYKDLRVPYYAVTDTTREASLTLTAVPDRPNLKHVSWFSMAYPDTGTGDILALGLFVRAYYDSLAGVCAPGEPGAVHNGGESLWAPNEEIEVIFDVDGSIHILTNVVWPSWPNLEDWTAPRS